MAIVNLTPDSFSGDGLSEKGVGTAVAVAVAAVDGGADLVDLGAESTRPQAVPISAEQEQARLLPVLEKLLCERPEAVISVDTYHAETARAAAMAGAEVINDVSGLQWDPAMAEAVAETGCGLVLMHTRGRPAVWEGQAAWNTSALVPRVFAELCERLALAEAAGIPSEKIVLDPGFGFGKAGRENMTLLAGMERMAELGRPLLAGLSRKGFLGQAVRPVQAGEAAPAVARRVATIAGNVAAIFAGAHLLRVHELQDAREAAAVADELLVADPA